MAWTPPTQAEVEGSVAPCKNWGRWGDDDQRGTLTLMTPDKRQAALTLAQRGRLVSLARDIIPNANLDYQMLCPDTRERSGVGMDYFGMVFHGTACTHMDALCHIAYDGKIYGGQHRCASPPHGDLLGGTADFRIAISRGVDYGIGSSGLTG